MLDMYISGDLGLWAIQNMDCSKVSCVISQDSFCIEFCTRNAIPYSLEPPDYNGSQSNKCALSVHYPKILPVSVINIYDNIYNLHPGYLPYGRGYYPIFWALYEGTPAGATLHSIVEEVDAGPIVEQIEVPYSERDTGESLFNRVRKAEKELFMKYILQIAEGKRLDSVKQSEGGSYHSKAEFASLKRADSISEMSSERVLRLIRCLSFTGYSGLEYGPDNNKMSYTAKEIL